MKAIIDRVLADKDYLVTIVGPFDEGAFDRYAA
jgi:hypothetical protein